MTDETRKRMQAAVEALDEAENRIEAVREMLVEALYPPREPGPTTKAFNKEDGR